MSVEVFIYTLLYRKGKYVSQSMFAYFGADFFKRERERQKLWLELLAALFLCSVLITQPWKEPACSLGRNCAESGSLGAEQGWTVLVETVRMGSQGIRGKNSQNLGSETREPGAGRIQERCHK